MAITSRVTQVGAIVVEKETPTTRVTQVGAIVVEKETPVTRATQVALICVYPFASPPAGGASPCRAYLVG